MDKKTETHILIKKNVKAEIIRIQGQLMVKTGKKLSISKTVEHILNIYKSFQK